MAQPSHANDQAHRQKMTRIPRTQCSTNTEQINTWIDHYEANGCHYAGVGGVAVGDFFPFVPAFELVFMNTDPYGPDVYKQGKKFRLHYHALLKLAAAANISWEPGATGVAQMEYGKYVVFDAVGKAVRPDGIVFSMVASGEVNEEIIREDLESEWQAKADAKQFSSDQEKKIFLDSNIDRDVRQKKRHMVALAESKAKGRVIRAILGLKGEYTDQEINMPFLVVWYTPREDYKDPVARERAIARAQNNVTKLFGPGKNNSPPTQSSQQENLPEPPADQPQQPVAHPPSAPSDRHVPVPGTDGFIPAEPWPLDVFGLKPRDIRIAVLKAFADHVNYQGVGRDETKIMKMDENTMVQFYETLLAKAAGR